MFEGPNNNVLAGLQCPNTDCGAYAPFRIDVTAVVDVYDDGSDPMTFTEVDWHDGNFCKCLTCGFHGEVREFRTN
jgi:hypothetical protein